MQLFIVRAVENGLVEYIFDENKLTTDIQEAKLFDDINLANDYIKLHHRVSNFKIHKVYRCDKCGKFFIGEIHSINDCTLCNECYLTCLLEATLSKGSLFSNSSVV